MATVTLPNTLTNGTTADADEVQGNDNALRDGVNNVEAEQIVDGTITDAEFSDAVSPVIRYNETGGQNFVVDGANWITTTTSVDLNYTVPSFVSYVQGVRLSNAGFARLYTALRDTYIDQDNMGNLTFSEVANGASAPPQAVSTLRLLKVVADGSKIIDVETLARITAETALTPGYAFIEANISRDVNSPEVMGNQEITLIFKGLDSSGDFQLDTGTAGVTIDTAIKQLVNGLDQNIILTAATPVDVYCIGSADGSQPTGGLLSYESSPFGTGSPLLPTGYDIFRWVGTLMTTPVSPDGIYVMPSVQNNGETILMDHVRDAFAAVNNGNWHLYDLSAFVNTDHVGAVILTSNITNGNIQNGYGSHDITGTTVPTSQAGAVSIANVRGASSAFDSDGIQASIANVPISNAGLINLYHQKVVDGTGGGGQGGNASPSGITVTGWTYKHD